MLILSLAAFKAKNTSWLSGVTMAPFLLVDDKHDVAIGLADEFDEDRGERGTCGCSRAVQLDTRTDACRAEVHARGPAQL